MEHKEALSHEFQNGRDEKMLSMDLWSEIRIMSRMGKPIKRIAREMGISKNTVKKALQLEQYQPYLRQKTNLGLLSEYMPFLMERAVQLDFNATNLFRELKEKGYSGGYTTVREAVRPLRENYRQVEAATVRFETPPGLQAQMDWGSTQVIMGGQKTRIHIFVLVLGFSRTIYTEFTLNEKLPTLIACHERAFQWFGGITEEILYDNPRTIVFDRGTANARLNPKFQDFCQYYGYVPKLCRPYRARTKGKVESGVKYVKRSFLPGKEFSSLIDANEQVLKWIRQVADQRIHGTVHEKPAERFLKEILHPVTGKPPYLLQTCELRKVAADCLISYGTSRYSVPWKYVNQVVDVQERSDGSLYIYHKGSLIAQHLKAREKHQVIMEPEHYRDLLGIVPRRERAEVFLPSLQPDVQVRSLEVYESLASGGVLHG